MGRGVDRCRSGRETGCRVGVGIPCVDGEAAQEVPMHGQGDGARKVEAVGPLPGRVVARPQDCRATAL